MQDDDLMNCLTLNGMDNMNELLDRNALYVDVVKNILNLTWRKIQIWNVCFIPSDQFNYTFNCILNVNVRDFSGNLNNLNKIVNEKSHNIY